MKAWCYWEWLPLAGPIQTLLYFVHPCLGPRLLLNPHVPCSYIITKIKWLLQILLLNYSVFILLLELLLFLIGSQEKWAPLSQCVVSKVTCCCRLGWLCAAVRQSYRSHLGFDRREMTPDWCYLNNLLSLSDLWLDDQGLRILLINHSKPVSMWIIYAMAFPIKF